MGRSVSYANGAEAIAYQVIEPDSIEAEDFSYMIENVQECAKSKWKSFHNCSKWLDREDHAILENNFAYIGLSEYCGLVSIWIVVKELEDNRQQNLADRYVSSIKENFLKMFNQYDRIGVFSNGEAIYKKVG